MTFEASDAMGWEAFKRVEHKDGVPAGVSFERSDPKAALTGFFLESGSKVLRASSASTSKNAGSSLEESPHNGLSRHRLRNSLRWGGAPVSVTRSASVTTLSSAVKMAIGDVNALGQTAPLVVSSFKQAEHEWRAAVAPTGDPFAFIDAKSQRLTSSPLNTNRAASGSCNVECAGGGASEALCDVQAAEVRSFRRAKSIANGLVIIV